MNLQFENLKCVSNYLFFINSGCQFLIFAQFQFGKICGNLLIAIFQFKQINFGYSLNFFLGGGTAGCNLLYQLSKRGIQAVLLERGKVTNGTTWHTGGLLWRLSNSGDVDIHLLEASRNIYMGLEQDTGVHPGLVMNGGLFIARTDVSFHQKI